MKAIVKRHPTKGLWMEEREIPSYGDNEVLVKVKKSSICGTDVHLYVWDEWAAKTLPLNTIIGHEFVGEIVALGKNVHTLKKGMRVSSEGHITCGSCTHCRTGRRVLCPQTVGTGVNKDGAFAEYIAVPEENVFPMPDEIPDDIACIFDPLGNAVHTALAADLVGKDVLVTGAGPIGLMSIPVVLKAGARRVVVTDINDLRLEMAKEMGASATVNVQTHSLQEEMKRLRINEGFDVVLEMSGSPKALQTAVDVAIHGGEIILLGIVPANTQIDWHKVIFKMLIIKGIYGREIFKTWYQVTHLLQSGLDISKVITHHLPADEFEKGFEIMLSGKSGKIILDWEK
jgi:threonine 3-dehydrogenase